MITSIFLLLLLQAPNAAITPPAVDTSSAVAFFKAAGAILDAGPALWDKIGKYQADNSVQEVATGASNLDISKTELRDDILEGRIVSKDDLYGRITVLETQVTEYHDLLGRFGAEIDKSSNNIGNDIRIAAELDIHTKAGILVKLNLRGSQTTWPPTRERRQS